MWGDYDGPAELKPICCGRLPTLRLDERMLLGHPIPYVRLKCRQCGRKGGLALDEHEAERLWDEAPSNPVPYSMRG